MGDYTRVGVTLWQWRRYLDLSPLARTVWLALYTTASAKRWPPGLYLGGPAVIAEDAHVSFSDANDALDEMVEKKLIEVDHVARIIRMTELPDRGERSSNGAGVMRWWSGFKTMPPCAVRDRHVELLHWLLQPLTKDHEQAWAKTFATVQPPRQGYHEGYYTPVTPSSKQVDMFGNNNIGVLPGVVQGVLPRVHTETVYGSGRTDQGEGSGERELADGSVDGDWPDHGVLAAGTSPDLRPPAPAAPSVSAADMLACITRHAGGRFQADLVDDRLDAALVEIARQCSAKGVSLPDFELVGKYLAAGGMAWRKDLGALWASKPGNLLDMVAQARGWSRGEITIAPGAAAAPKRSEPAPPQAFTPGRRAL